MDKVTGYDYSFKLLILDHNGYEYGYSVEEKKFIDIFRDREWHDIEDYEIIEAHPITDKKFIKSDYLNAEIECLKAEQDLLKSINNGLETELKEKDEYIGWIKEFGLEEAERLLRIKKPLKYMFENCATLTTLPKIQITDRVAEEMEKLRAEMQDKRE